MDKNLEKTLDFLNEPEKEGLHPAFSQCLPVFILPFGMFMLLPFGAKPHYVYFFFVYLETFFYLLAKWYRLSTHYVFWPDRIEMRSGLFKTTSKAIPFDEMTEVILKQSLYQRLFKIGDIFIHTAGGENAVVALAGVKYPKQITKALFAMKIKRGTLKAFAALFLTALLALQPLFAGTTTGDDKTQEALRSNVVDLRDWLMKQLSAFPKAPSNGNPFVSRNYTGLGKRTPGFTANQFNQARKSDWAKCQIMDGLSTLSQQLAKTAGTAFALQSANQLNQYAAQLKQSDDPEFQKIGILYTQEAQALQTGNIQAADQAANQVSAIPKPYVPPGYQPSQGESQLVQAFNQVIGTIIAGLGGILGTFAVAQILQALGIPNLSALLGTGQMAGTSLATGQNPSAVANNAGANVVYTGGNAVMNQLGSVNVSPRQSQNSANAGGAPAAQ